MEPYRCAELTLAKGGDYFILAESATDLRHAGAANKPEMRATISGFLSQGVAGLRLFLLSQCRSVSRVCDSLDPYSCVATVAVAEHVLVSLATFPTLPLSQTGGDEITEHFFGSPAKLVGSKAGQLPLGN